MNSRGSRPTLTAGEASPQMTRPEGEGGVFGGDSRGTRPTGVATSPAVSDRAKLRRLAHCILMDYGVPPALAVACGRALVLGDGADLESMCREAWGDEGFERVIAPAVSAVPCHTQQGVDD